MLTVGSAQCHGGTNRSLGGPVGGGVNGASEAQPGTGEAWLGLRDCNQGLVKPIAPVFTHQGGFNCCCRRLARPPGCKALKQ